MHRIQLIFLTVFFTAFFCCLGFVSEVTFISLNNGYIPDVCNVLVFYWTNDEQIENLKEKSKKASILLDCFVDGVIALECAILIYLGKVNSHGKCFLTVGLVLRFSTS